MEQDKFDTKRECKCAGKCGACQTLNLTYGAELSLKMKQEITLLGKFCHVDEIIPMEKPEAEAEHVPSEREEKLVAAVNEKKNQATRKLDSVLRQLGSKAKNMMDKTKEKPEQKKEDKQEPKKPEETEIPKSPVQGESFEVPRPESAEELAKRTGWSEETIRGFFEGLDMESQQEDKEKK